MRLLPILLALQQALWIDVPYVRQDKKGCGSASLWMIMEYWQPGGTPAVGNIQAQLYSKQAEGIFARDMRTYLETHGYRVFTFQGAWNDLEANVSKGRPLIVGLGRGAGAASLHYVVVAGIDTTRDLLLINDPAQRKLMSISRSEFERDWKTTDNWTLLAVPELRLASSAFRDGNLAQAREHLNLALRSDPSDAYINQFLATVYFLQGNNESALKYWNRGGKPIVENIRIDPPLLADPLLIDRAFTFARGSILTPHDYRTTQSRLEAAGIFSRYRLDLELSVAPGTAGDRFDVVLRAAERHGTNFLSWFRGLPYQTVYADFSNLGGKALNLESMVRWDSNKRRVSAGLAVPLGGNPKWGVRMGLDGREERWRDSKESFRMRKVEVTAEVHSVPSGRWNWSSGIALSHRDFSNSLSSGFALKYLASVTQRVIQDTDRRVNVDASLSLESGAMLNSKRQQFLKLRNNVSVRWLPLAKHQDNEITAKAYFGRAFGTPPLDELFPMGLDRDSNLLLRAHSTTPDGLKSSRFVGRSFVLANTDYQKVLGKTGLFRLSAGPFFDAGHGPISPNWLFDAGAQLRVTAFGALTLNVSYGKSLSDGRRAFFVGGPR